MPDFGCACPLSPVAVTFVAVLLLPVVLALRLLRPACRAGLLVLLLAVTLLVSLLLVAPLLLRLLLLIVPIVSKPDGAATAGGGLLRLLRQIVHVVSEPDRAATTSVEWKTCRWITLAG